MIQNVSSIIKNENWVEAIHIALTLQLHYYKQRMSRIKWVGKIGRKVGGQWDGQCLFITALKLLIPVLNIIHQKNWPRTYLYLNWDLVFNIWLECNKTEHDERWNPELRQKEKLFEKIQGESAIMNFSVYKENELIVDELIKLPIENLLTKR
jgi:hypothetical protein